MRPARQTRFRMPRKKLREPELGDWRVPVDDPFEAEHREPEPMPGVMRRVRMRASFLSSMEADYRVDREVDWTPIRGWKMIIRRIIGLCCLLPLSVVMVFALLLQLYHATPLVGDFAFWQSVPVWYTVLGILVFATIKYFRLVEPILMFVYVLGHELTHAITALMCFGKVQAFCVDLNGGYVDTDTDNIFVSLSPYFVPLWMLFWLGGMYVANWIVPFEAYLPWFYAGFGFWWAFHVYWTMWIIPREQPDLLENGVIFSFMIIMLSNIAALLVILRCFGVISLRGYWQDFKTCAQAIYVTYHDLAVWLWQLM